VDRVNDRLDRALFIQLEQLGEYLQDVSTRVIHLIRKQEIVQIEAGQGAALVVQLKRRDLIDVPPVLRQCKVVLALAIAQVLRRAVKYVLAEWLRDADALISMLTT